MRVYQLQQKLKHCDPNALVIIPNYHDEDEGFYEVNSIDPYGKEVCINSNYKEKIID